MVRLSALRASAGPGWRRWSLWATLACGIVVSFAILADEAQADRRVQLGAKLFPAVVAADQELGSKLSADGLLHIVVLYREDAEAAEETARRIAATKRVKDFPVHTTICPYARLDELRIAPPAALFMAEAAPDELPAVIRFGNEHHRLVFSPFYGDVGAGVQTGIVITDRIVPLVNLQALKSAGIQMKPFFLEVARTHE